MDRRAWWVVASWTQLKWLQLYTSQKWTASGAGAPGAVDLGMAYAPLEEVTINPPYNPQNLHRTGETDSGTAQTEPYAHQNTEERSSDPTRDWLRIASECPGASFRGMGQ